ncbi:hypothetical protein RintRC_4790 [Richelia intracellularis]|nr:hypothetical protein RintRC_4790 [Richelia intracellularis]
MEKGDFIALGGRAIGYLQPSQYLCLLIPGVVTIFFPLLTSPQMNTILC